MAEIPQVEQTRASKTPLSPEYPLPPGGFTGEAMFDVAREHLVDYCNTHKIQPAVIEQVLEEARTWARAEPGQPVICLGQTLGRTVFSGGGKIVSPLYMKYGFENRYPRFTFEVERHDFAGWHESSGVTVTAEELAWALQGSQRLIELVVGEQAVRECLKRIGRGMQGECSEIGETYQICKFLNSTKNARIPLEFYGFDDDARATVCTRIVEAMLTEDDSYSQNQQLTALTYLAGAETPEQFAGLFDSIEEQFAGVLPLTDGDAEAVSIAALEGLVTHHAPNPAVVGSASQTSLTREILHCSMVADLYERRAAQEHERARELPEIPLVVPAAVIPEPFERRDIMIFRTSYPRTTDTEQDIAYLRALAARGEPVTQTVERDMERMRMAIDNLARYAAQAENPVVRAEAFLAMEYLFDLQRPEQQQEFYRLMGERFALRVPLEGRFNLREHIRVADTMSQLMPVPLRAPDEIMYAGDARVAATLAQFYRQRTMQLVKRELRRFTPLEEGED